jgi:hypothetical protein
MPGTEKRHAAYETRDANLSLVAWMGIGISVLTVAALLGMAGLLGFFVERDAASQPESASLLRAEGGTLPPEPRLEDDPVGNRMRIQADEREMLESYGWQDERKEILRIPIERAMELTAERGLPVRSEDAP